jgi:hypothetical protein
MDYGFGFYGVQSRTETPTFYLQPSEGTGSSKSPHCPKYVYRSTHSPVRRSPEEDPQRRRTHLDLFVCRYAVWVSPGIARGFYLPRLGHLLYLQLPNPHTMNKILVWAEEEGKEHFALLYSPLPWLQLSHLHKGTVGYQRLSTSALPPWPTCITTFFYLFSLFVVPKICHEVGKYYGAEYPRHCSTH